MSKPIKASVIFERTVSLLRKKTRRIVHQGGQSSGKTVNILMSLAVYANENPGCIITVTSESFPHLKAGALRDFERFVYPVFAGTIEKYHKTDHVFTFRNKAIIEFKTYETEYAARGAKRQVLFINEANTFDYMTFFQLDSRSDHTIIDYNPTIRFWAHEKVIGESGTEFVRSWHEHNLFLTPEKHAEIEAICTFKYDKNGKKELKDDGIPVILKGDYELWKVYARGLTGNISGIIYPDWTMIDELPDSLDDEKWVYSIDFGYTNDPTAIARSCRLGNKIYVDEVCYTTGGMTAKKIKDLLENCQYDPLNHPFYCEHDPDMIKQLKLLKVRAISARKGAGSIKAGIEKIKEYEIFYTASSRNIKKELSKYIWEMDDMGKPTNSPIDANNHILDAIRYGIYSHFYRSKNQ